MNSKILVVDDQLSFCRHIQTILKEEDYTVDLANNAEKALEKLTADSFDILLTDMKMPGMNGLQLYNTAIKNDPDICCIIMTAYGSITSAVDSIKQGVKDYIQKPFEPELLTVVVEKTLKEKRMLKEIKDLRKEVDLRYSFGNIIGKTRKMQDIYDLIEKVAPTDVRVLITGETGVGKELVAKALHFNSPRKNKPFVDINCGALAENLLETELFGYEKGAFTGALQRKEGKFEYARGGTIFLDEIGDISPAMQVKLLRVLQENRFVRVGSNTPIDTDVRIISATNKNLSEKIRQDTFRIELFYRLNVVPIQIPPLRERIEDIPLLVNHFRSQLNKQLGTHIRQIVPYAMKQLMEYPWPGNVRELENVLERAFVTTEGEIIEQILFFKHSGQLGDQVSTDMVNIEIPFSVAKSLVMKKFEKTYLFEALKKYRGNISQTARKTGVTPRTIWRKIKDYHLNVNALKHRD